MSDKLSSMRYAGRVNLAAINWGFHHAKPGKTLAEVDAVIEDYIRKAGCVPAFKNYQPEGYPLPFPATACISPNDVVVHGIPGDYVLENGDLLTIDVGTQHEGWFVDAARSRVIRSESRMTRRQLDRCFLAQKLVDATEAILEAQLSVIKNDCDFLTIVRAAEEEAAARGVTIMHQWGGHGIADRIHMDPFIPNALDRTKPLLTQNLEKRRLSQQKLTTGQTICVEPVTTFGSPDIIIDDDQWTIRQTEGKLAAHSERCLLVTEDGYELLS